MLDFSQSIKALEVTQKILILPSQPVDGDCLGSALAMYKVLREKGKTVTVVLTTDIPDIYKFLPGSQDIQKEAKVYSDFVVTIDLKDTKVSNLEHEIVDNKINIIVTPEKGSLTADQVSFPKPDKMYDLLLILDTADLTQLGDFYIQNYSIFSEVPSINIDHHSSNTNFASINLVDPTACSTTQIIYNLLKTMGSPIDADTATLLLTGIITDTGSFQNANTTPEAFDLSADLIELGARQQEIVRQIYKTKQLETLKLWGRILSNIQVDLENKLVWSKATQADFSETNTTDKDTGDIMDDLLANAEEADTVLLLVEKGDGNVSGSIRTTTEALDASQMAAMFGGGGHSRSAGFVLYGTNLSLVEQDILDKIRGFKNKAEAIPQIVQTEPIAAQTENSEQVSQETKKETNELPPELPSVEQLTRDFVSKPTESSENN